MRLSQDREAQGLHVRVQYLHRQVSDHATEAVFGVPVLAPHRAILYRQAHDLRVEAEGRGMPGVVALLDHLIVALDRFAPTPVEDADAKDGAA